MLTEEKKLARLIQQGDQEAYKRAFELYYAGLLAYGNYLVNNTEISRDLVQEVFLKLWEKRQKISIHSSLKAYLYTAINHLSLNHIRHQKVENAFQKHALSHWIFDDSNQINVNPFLREKLKEVIDGLPPKAHQCFMLSQVEGLSVREVAQNLGVSEKTVENQLARSRKILQKKLKSYRN